MTGNLRQGGAGLGAWDRGSLGRGKEVGLWEWVAPFAYGRWWMAFRARASRLVPSLLISMAGPQIWDSLPSELHKPVPWEGCSMALSLPECDVFVVVGEPSGDAYAAAVISELQRQYPDLRVAAAACEGVRAAGAEIDVDMSGYAVMGFVAVFKRLAEFRRLGRQVARIIRARRPRVVITVDYPGFNLRLLAHLQDLRQSGCVFCHVVAPQVWAWKPRRAKKVAQLVDQLCCFFPFEPPLFTRHGGAASFVGHPLVDQMPKPSAEANRAARQRLGIAADIDVLLMAPGSREHEVSSLLPLFDEAYAMVAHRLRGPRPILPLIAKAPALDHALYRRFSHHRLVEGGYREILACARAGMIASGTATLEAALAGVPHLIAYRGDTLSATIAKHVILTDHVGLPNIVHARRVCPEILQDQCTAIRLAAHLERMWRGPVHNATCTSLLATRDRLGSGGAISRIAALIAPHLKGAGDRRRDSTIGV
ncbi:MAG: lipid-A-disaccharide synthase [Planctomycetota bacterium]|nr:MAG: lipid-A-disaccharide synthase [Planctomycetota bacterium]